MKKTLVAAALILSLALICCACGEKTPASADTIEGSYRLIDASGEGSYELLQLRNGVKLTVYADNYAALSLMTDTHELYFDTENWVCTSADDDTPVPYTFDGNQIVMDNEHFRMIFVRQ
jgi:hypothetical protein